MDELNDPNGPRRIQTGSHISPKPSGTIAATTSDAAPNCSDFRRATSSPASPVSESYSSSQAVSPRDVMIQEDVPEDEQIDPNTSVIHGLELDPSSVLKHIIDQTALLDETELLSPTVVAEPTTESWMVDLYDRENTRCPKCSLETRAERAEQKDAARGSGTLNGASNGPAQAECHETSRSRGNSPLSKPIANVIKGTAKSPQRVPKYQHGRGLPNPRHGHVARILHASHEHISEEESGSRSSLTSPTDSAAFNPTTSPSSSTVSTNNSAASSLMSSSYFRSRESSVCDGNDLAPLHDHPMHGHTDLFKLQQAIRRWRLPFTSITAQLIYPIFHENNLYLGTCFGVILLYLSWGLVNVIWQFTSLYLLRNATSSNEGSHPALITMMEWEMRLFATLWVSTIASRALIASKIAYAFSKSITRWRAFVQAFLFPPLTRVGFRSNRGSSVTLEAMQPAVAPRSLLRSMGPQITTTTPLSFPGQVQSSTSGYNLADPPLPPPSKTLVLIAEVLLELVIAPTVYLLMRTFGIVLITALLCAVMSYVRSFTIVSAWFETTALSEPIRLLMVVGLPSLPLSFSLSLPLARIFIATSTVRNCRLWFALLRNSSHELWCCNRSDHTVRVEMA